MQSVAVHASPLQAMSDDCTEVAPRLSAAQRYTEVPRETPRLHRDAAREPSGERLPNQL